MSALQRSGSGVILGGLVTEFDDVHDLATTDEQSGVLDEAEELSPLDAQTIRYDITSYGADFPVDGLMARLERGDIYIPQFQREFVWSKREASRFIESLLLGLPVPGIFLSRDSEGRLLVVDGQQRLSSLRAYYTNNFRGDSFRLEDVDPSFNGKRYSELDESDRRTLNDSILHATIVQQNEPWMITVGSTAFSNASITADGGFTRKKFAHQYMAGL